MINRYRYTLQNVAIKSSDHGLKKITCWFAANSQGLEHLFGFELADVGHGINEPAAAEWHTADVIDEGVVHEMQAEHVDEDLIGQELALDVLYDGGVALLVHVERIERFAVREQHERARHFRVAVTTVADVIELRVGHLQRAVHARDGALVGLSGDARVESGMTEIVGQIGHATHAIAVRCDADSCRVAHRRHVVYGADETTREIKHLRSKLCKSMHNVHLHIRLWIVNF